MRSNTMGPDKTGSGKMRSNKMRPNRTGSNTMVLYHNVRDSSSTYFVFAKKYPIN